MELATGAAGATDFGLTRFDRGSPTTHAAASGAPQRDAALTLEWQRDRPYFRRDAGAGSAPAGFIGQGPVRVGGSRYPHVRANALMQSSRDLRKRPPAQGFSAFTHSAMSLMIGSVSASGFVEWFGFALPVGVSKITLCERFWKLMKFRA